MSGADVANQSIEPADGLAEPMRASIIIPHLNTPTLLDKCLRALTAQKLDHGQFEILVVDNGSSEPLDAMARAWPDVRFLTEREPGPGPARNLGVAHAKGGVLAFIDADIRAGDGWLQQGVSAVERDPGHPYGGDVRIDFVDPSRPGAIEAFEAVFSFRQKMYIKHHGYSGAGNLMVNRDLWHQVGPFKGIGAAEDKDWGLRAKALGATACYLPDMVVYHPARTNMDEMQSRWDRLIAQSYTGHLARGKSVLAWRLRAWAVALSAFAHAPRLLLSPRVPTFGARVSGLKVLFATRMHRFHKMRSIPDEAHLESAMQWNRTP